MSDRQIDTRGPREPRGPAFDVEEEKLAAKVAAMDEPHNLPATEAVVVAIKAVRGLRADEKNGEAIWTTLAGLEVRGAAGRHAVVGELVEELRTDSHGRPVLEIAAKMFEERGVTRAEGLVHLQHRLRRLPDGQIQWSPGGDQRIRVGGDEVIVEAARSAYLAVLADRQARASAPLEADVRSRMRPV